MFGFGINQPRNERSMQGARLGGVKNAIFGVLAGAMLLFASGANAALLGLDLLLPDIFSTLSSVTYSANQLTVLGDNVDLTEDGTTFQSIDGTFSLTATISDLGVATDADLIILGKVEGVGTGTLLTGTLSSNPAPYPSAFGFSETSGAGVLEFIFDPTGGDLENLFTNAAPLVGVILTLFATDYDREIGSWSDDFTAAMGTADTAPVPLPGAMWLMGSGLIALFGIARRRWGALARRSS